MCLAIKWAPSMTCELRHLVGYVLPLSQNPQCKILMGGGGWGGVVWNSVEGFEQPMTSWLYSK